MKDIHDIHVEELVPEYIEIRSPDSDALPKEDVDIEEWFVENYQYEDEFFETGDE